jgi:hypothetical protein
MRYACIMSIGLVATVAFAWSAAAVENAHELAGYCQSLERGPEGDALGAATSEARVEPGVIFCTS